MHFNTKNHACIPDTAMGFSAISCLYTIVMLQLILSSPCSADHQDEFVVGVNPLPSLSAIADALESLGEQKLADDLRTA